MTALTPALRKAIGADELLETIRRRLETTGAITELYQFHHLSQTELDLVILQEISTPTTPTRPQARKDSSCPG